MGFEPTTPTLAIFWFIAQSALFCDISVQNEAEHNKNTTVLRGHSADACQLLRQLPA